ncbi:LysR family transcriptional regulator [Micromonospora sp. NBC_00617]|uniref:LysR family transcriptional regulator n=1 Tax=Micromonospora sp. NBC_00617 TaxID=2903587 RepID=UPI0030E44274
MDLRALETFLAVAVAGSFGRVAASMHVSQPTISARIAALEADLGGSLFDRGPRGAKLTDLGRAFLPYADRAVEALREGRSIATSGTLGRSLTLGVTASLSAGPFAAAVADLVSRLPDLRLRVLTAEAGELRRLLADRTVEAIYAPWPPLLDDLPARAEVLLTTQESLLLVVAPTHPLASLPEPIDFLDAVLAARPFLDLPVDYDQRVHRMATRSAAPAVVEIWALATAKTLLVRGVGAALLTPTLAEPELSARQLVAVDLREQRQRRSALVRLARPGPPGPTLQAFRDALHTNQPAVELP